MTGDIPPPTVDADGYEPMRGGGLQRTEINCHNCLKTFVAEIDLSINGNYTIVCPVCEHEHLRTVKNGKITEGRWGSADTSDKYRIDGRSTWRSNVVKDFDGQTISAGKTSTVATFLRERWLNRVDYNGR
jgi:hypothetical protein